MKSVDDVGEIFAMRPLERSLGSVAAAARVDGWFPLSLKVDAVAEEVLDAGEVIEEGGEHQNSESVGIFSVEIRAVRMQQFETFQSTSPGG